MNSIFHINVFSQIPLAPSSPIEGGENMVVAPIEEGKSSTNRIRTAVATGLLALSLSTGAQERPTALASNETQPILLAQANVEDGRTGPYSAIVPQVKGGSKMVEYYKNKRGLIIPPPIENGKLADGSDAPADPLEAKAEQRSIIAKYDKVVLVKTEKTALIRKADLDLKDIIAITKKGDTLTQEQLFNGFFSVHIIKLGLDHQGVNDLISGLESIAKIKMKLSESEIFQIKREAESRAINIWKSVSKDVV